MRRGVWSTAAFYSHAERGRCLGNAYYVPGILGIPGADDVGTQDVVFAWRTTGARRASTSSGLLFPDSPGLSNSCLARERQAFMELQIVDNRSIDLGSLLSTEIERSDTLRVAVAFASRSGLVKIAPSVRRRLDLGAAAEFLVGLDLSATEPEALWDLHELSREYEKAHVYCYADLGPSILYHPKLYIMRASEEAVVIVGSSNLTAGGLARNIEANAVIRAGVDEEVVSDAYAVYNTLKFHPQRVEPDADFLSLYEEVRELHRRWQRRRQKDSSWSRVASEFRAKAASLRRPRPSQSDLVGWLRLVYQRLPDGEFRTRDMYAHEGEFRQRYPANVNVRPKIRQQLQYLRDIGLVTHVGRGRWRRVEEADEP